MSHVKTLLGRVFLASWESGVVTREDALSIPQEVKKAGSSSGKPLVYIAIFAPTIPPPTDEVRKLMAQHMDGMLKVCSSMHLVFEGTGFRQTVQRMAMVSIMMLSGKRGRVFISSSIKEAVSLAPPEDSKDLDRALRQALEKGYLQKNVQRAV
jgi:hypothetical protein